ncbi:hypothetical protein J2W36_004731 [Variovorax ginsengisoli]|uniref:Uncharacterized protein n=1 Tax=Variovorax ginsengisoli TaxID=363844 RepID=A0ABT9SDL5_9BURK|nr:hypothetical protein [Variovorax ginsengisoli]
MKKVFMRLVVVPYVLVCGTRKYLHRSLGARPKGASRRETAWMRGLMS